MLTNLFLRKQLSVRWRQDVLWWNCFRRKVFCRLEVNHWTVDKRISVAILTNVFWARGCNLLVRNFRKLICKVLWLEVLIFRAFLGSKETNFNYWFKFNCFVKLLLFQSALRFNKSKVEQNFVERKTKENKISTSLIINFCQQRNVSSSNNFHIFIPQPHKFFIFRRHDQKSLFSFHPVRQFFPSATWKTQKEISKMKNASR